MEMQILIEKILVVSMILLFTGSILAVVWSKHPACKPEGEEE